MSTERPLRFLRLLLSVPALVLAGTALVCFVVDPFGLYRPWPAWDGVNAHKPRQRGHERLVRAADLRRLRPDALLLGTSRSQVGLDPAAPSWSGIARSPANAALSDGTCYEALRYLQHAHALSPLKVVVFGADYLSFISKRRFASDFTEERLAVAPSLGPQPFARVADLPSTLLSLDALRLSRRTVLEQADDSYFFDSGRRRTTTMEARLVEQGGARGAFLWSERDYADSYACADSTRLPTQLADFEALVAFARAQQIRLIVLWSPTHVRAQVLLQAAGLWPEVERFKGGLARIALESGVELWEFGGADPRSTAEVVPSVGDSVSRLRWYWESSHYRKELGDVVLARVLGAPVPEEALVDWGEQVTTGNVNRVLARVDAEVAAWRSTHPLEVAELERVVARARLEKDCARSDP
jgi:hypothetical protein